MEDFFDELFKCSILFGMSSEEFWFGNPQHYFVYQKAYIEKINRNHEESEINAWMCGKYNLLAFQQVYSSAWGKNKKNIYPDKPYFLKDNDNKKQSTSAEDKRNKFIGIMTMFNNSRKR